MKGKHRVVVSTKRLKYDFEIRRNLTIVRGDSAASFLLTKEMNLSRQKNLQGRFRKRIIIT